MNINFVKQVHKKGCGIACIAMVMNKSYEEIVKDFHNDFNFEGISSEDLIDYLADNGFSVIYKENKYWSEINFARDEMIKPFAPVHIVAIKQKADVLEHYVVMDSQGSFICPAEQSDEEIRNSYAFKETIGLYR